MKILRYLSIAALFVASVTATAFATPKSIKVATDATWPPMEMVDANMLIVG